MKYGDAVVAASAAADAVLKYFSSTAPRHPWHRLLVHKANKGMKLQELADFVRQHPGAPADALYRFGSGRAYDDMPFGSDAALAAAVETFGACLEKYLSRVERDAASPSPRPQRRLESVFDDDERRPGLRDRSSLGPRPPRQALTQEEAVDLAIEILATAPAPAAPEASLSKEGKKS